ncbi:MAG: cation:proton antiporter [Geminicoccaceae bacterium]|nr:cation:proton antiporter [Geminicoccaceae bacterium]
MSQIAGSIFAFAGLLGLIALLPPLAERLRLPYTVLLAGLGIVLGFLIGAAPALRPYVPDDVFLDYVAALGEVRITSGVFLWVLLPGLIFQASLELDSRALWDDIGPILLMAVVAVLATTLIAGLPVGLLSGLGVPAGLLVAAIVATTDPVAVIAIFREVGAPRRLVGLVEGESLLNDAAAIALTASLLAIVVSGSVPEPSELALDFLHDFAGGALLGAVLGRLAAFLIARLDEGGPAEVTLSVALAYLAYALGEAHFGVSGVVAVVAAGLVFGAYARATLPTAAWQSVAAVWLQLSFWSSSLIFVLASMLVPKTLAAATPFDLALLGLLLLGALAARAFVLFALLPLLRLVGLSSRIQPGYRVVMLWGGLRGAVTLALALAVTENRAVPEELQRHVAVLATGFVLFTLIVQGLSLRSLIRRLGLDQLDPAERFQRERALRLTHDEIFERLNGTSRAYGLEAATMEGVGSLYRRRVEAIPFEPSLGEEMQRVQLASALLTLTRKEARLYVDEGGRRMATRASMARLVREANALIDALRGGGEGGGLEAYRHLARLQLRPNRWIRAAAWLHRRFRIDRPLASALAGVLERALFQRSVLDDLEGFNRERIAGLFGARIAEVAARFLALRREGLERNIDALKLQYPDYWEAFSQRYVHLATIRLEYLALERMAEERLLAPQIIDRLHAELRSRHRRLDRPPALDLRLDSLDLVRHTPLFDGLDAVEQKAVARLLVPRLAIPGERIVRKDEAGDAMYFVASGAVEVAVEPEPVRLGTGDYFGEMALLNDRPRLADVTALSYCRLLVLYRERFDAFLRNHPDLDQQMRNVAQQREVAVSRET